MDVVECLAEFAWSGGPRNLTRQLPPALLLGMRMCTGFTLRIVGETEDHGTPA